MEEMIASYLILNGECLLPGIGKLLVSRRNAVCDVASKLLYPPEKNIKFENTAVGDSQGLVRYISSTLNCPVEEASRELDLWTGNLKQRLDREDEVTLPFLGIITKESDADYGFSPQNSLNIFDPVPAVRVVHDKDTHDVVAGDRIYKSSEMNDVLNGSHKTAPRSIWLPALIIFAIAIVLIILYYTEGGFDDHLILQKTPPTYIFK